MDIELIGGVSAVFLLIAVIEVIKMVYPPLKGYAPIIAIVLGLAVSFSYTFYGDTEYFQAAISGLAIGLSAVGLFSGAKNTKETINK